MRFKNCVFLLLFALLNFTGCSVVEMEQPTQIVENQEEISDEDQMLSEFEDEVEIEEIYDPLNGYNRIMTSFNDSVYVNVLTPVATGYKKVLNKDVRESVSNFFSNLYFPVRFVNNVLQGKVANATEETGRFVVNSTLGIFGLFDIAKSEYGLQEHKEDFGQTLGSYGVGSGPHIVLPIFGPSNLRDTFGMFPDAYLSPIDYKERNWFTVTDTWQEFAALKSYESINKFSFDVEQYEKLKEDAVDLYPYLRDVYEQYRNKQIEE